MTSMHPAANAQRTAHLKKAMHDHWGLFLVEGIILGVLGVAAIIVPPIGGLLLRSFLDGRRAAQDSELMPKGEVLQAQSGSRLERCQQRAEQGCYDPGHRPRSLHGRRVSHEQIRGSGFWQA
jgi:hypothetical protein